MLRLASLLHLYHVRVRRRVVPELLALIGIAVGVALVFTALVANSSLVGATERVTAGVVGKAEFQIASRGGRPFATSVYKEVQRLSGVQMSAPILDTRALLIGRRNRVPVSLMGVDSHLAQLDGSLLRRFKSVKVEALRSIILPVPLARKVGVAFAAKVTVQTGRKTTSGVPALPLPTEDMGGLVESPMVIAPLPYAQALSGLPAQITRILVRPRPGRSEQVRMELERIAGSSLSVQRADAEVNVFRQAAIPINQSTALFSLFAMLVGFLFALSAVLLTVPQRQRFVSDLRIAGYAPMAIVQVMAFDALVLGAAGSLVGLLAGDVLSRGVIGAAPGYLSFAFPIGDQRIVTFASIAVAGASGLIAACVAVLAPLHNIFARQPSPANRTGSSSHHGLRPLAGAICLIGAAIVTLLAPVAAVAGLVLLTIALLLLLPTLLRWSIALADTTGHSVKSPVPALAVMELRAGRTRTRSFALAATAAIAVFASVSISGAQDNLQRGMYVTQRQLDRIADIWATFPGAPNTFATTPLALGAKSPAAINKIPGVASVHTYRGGFLDIGNRRVWVLAPPANARVPVPTTQVTDGDPADAATGLRTTGTVVLSQGVADALKVGVGDRIRLPTPVPISLRITALTTNLGWPPGTAVMSAADYARGWNDQAPTGLLVNIAPGGDTGTIIRKMRAVLGPTARLAIETADAREARQREATRQGLSRTTQISAIVLWAAILALATATGGVIWQRRTTIARLKVDGLTEVQLWKGLLLECGVLLGSGCFVGAVFALGGQLLLTRGLVAITDFPVIYTASIALAAERVLIVLTVALLMLALPGIFAVRVRPAVGHPH